MCCVLPTYPHKVLTVSYHVTLRRHRLYPTSLAYTTENSSCILLTYLQKVHTVSTACNKASFPVQVRPDRPERRVFSRCPRCGGPRRSFRVEATELMAAADCALVDQDWEVMVSPRRLTISSRYKRRPASVPDNTTHSVYCILLYSADNISNYVYCIQLTTYMYTGSVTEFVCKLIT